MKNATGSKKSFKQRLNAIINRSAKITLHSEELREADKIAMIKAKAEAYAANNPQPRAMYLLG